MDFDHGWARAVSPVRSILSGTYQHGSRPCRASRFQSLLRATDARHAVQGDVQSFRDLVQHARAGLEALAVLLGKAEADEDGVDGSAVLCELAVHPFVDSVESFHGEVPPADPRLSGRDDDPVAGTIQPRDRIETPRERPPLLHGTYVKRKCFVDDSVPLDDGEVQEVAPGTMDPLLSAAAVKRRLRRGHTRQQRCRILVRQILNLRTPEINRHVRLSSNGITQLPATEGVGCHGRQPRQRTRGRGTFRVSDGSGVAASGSS